MISGTAEENNTSNKVGGRTFKYIGETSRSLWERAEEHVLSGIRMDDGHFITKHWLLNHPTSRNPPVFKFSVMSHHSDPMSREVNEALLIETHRKSSNLLNSKKEWNSTPLARLTIELPEWKKKQASDLENIKEKHVKKRLQDFKNSMEKFKVSFRSTLNRTNTVNRLSELGDNNSLQPVENLDSGSFRPSGIFDNAKYCDVINQAENVVCSSQTIYRYLKRLKSPEAISPNPKRTKMWRSNFGKSRDFGAIPYSALDATSGSKLLNSKSNTGSVSNVERLTVNESPTRVRSSSVDCSALAVKKPTDHNIYSVMLNRTFESVSPRKQAQAIHDKQGLLWRLRNVDSLGDSSISKKITTPVRNDYNSGVDRDINNLIVSSMFKLSLNKRNVGNTTEFDLNTPLDPEILKYVELVRIKLDERSIENLFDSQKTSPLENLLCKMLENSCLSSPFNFETAVNVAMKNSDSGRLDMYWTPKILDCIGGSGTVSRTLIKLRETGVYKGVKRAYATEIKHHFNPSKYSRVGELESIMNKLSVVGPMDDESDPSPQPKRYTHHCLNNYQTSISSKIQIKSEAGLEMKIIGREVENKLGRSQAKVKCVKQTKILEHVTRSPRVRATSVISPGGSEKCIRQKLKFGPKKQSPRKVAPIRPYLQPRGAEFQADLSGTGQVSKELGAANSSK